MNTTFILNKAVEYFNGWNAERRTVAENEILFVRLFWVDYVYENGTNLTGFHDGDITSEFDAEQLKQEIVCLWVGGPGENLTATADDFVVINAEEYNVGHGVPVFALPDPDGWETEGPDFIWNETVSNADFDPATFSILAGTTDDPNQPRDDMWLVNPLHGDGDPGSHQLQRVRPLMQMVEKTITFILDGSTSTGEETYGDFFALIPAVMDADFDMHIYVNPTTSMPATAPIGWFGLRLEGEAGRDGAIPILNIQTSNPLDTYLGMNDPSIPPEDMRPSTGWYRFHPVGQVPAGFYAEVTVVMKYKQRFIGYDRLEYVEPF